MPSPQPCTAVCTSAVLSPLDSVSPSANSAEASSSRSLLHCLRPWVDQGGNSGSSLPCLSLNFPDCKTGSPSAVKVLEE